MPKTANNKEFSKTDHSMTKQLVVDDLRMVAGDTAFFSFVLATKDNNDLPWQGIVPTDAPVITIDNQPAPSRLSLIKQGFRRVVDESAVDADGGWQVVD